VRGTKEEQSLELFPRLGKVCPSSPPVPIGMPPFVAFFRRSARSRDSAIAGENRHYSVGVSLEPTAVQLTNEDLIG
jgi:hypothetical protein